MPFAQARHIPETRPPAQFPPARRRPPGEIGWLLAACLLIASATLWPAPENRDLAAETPLFCLVCGSLGLMDVVLNVVLFMPFGAAMAARTGGGPGRRVLTAALTGLGLSFAIETTQYFFLTGRDASLSDLVTNATGSALGSLIVAFWPQLVAPNRRLAWRFGLAAAAGWVLQATIVAWSLGPSLPRTLYFGQWAPKLGTLAQFEGTIVTASVGDLPLAWTSMPYTPALRDALASGQPMRATVVSGPPTAGLAPVVSIFDDEQQEIAMLGQMGRAAAFHLRLRSSLLRLRTPSVRLDDAFPAEAGDTLHVAGRLAHGALEVSSVIGGVERRHRLPLSAHWGWFELMPFGAYHLGPEARLLTAIWILALVLPFGFYMGRLHRDREARSRVYLLIACTGLAGVVVIPVIAGLPLAHWSEWAGFLAGVTAGGALGRRVSG
ncbi:MAG: VanZ family protein [Gemmatimonadota bacterium]